MSSAVALEVDGAVAVIRLQRPQVHNALDSAMLTQLVGTVEQIAADPNVRGVVLTGNDRAFCTGEDLRAAAGMDAAAFRAQVADLQRLAGAIRAAPQPFVAAIGGYAYGGGLEIAVNCDARIATRNARFACPEVAWGLTLTNGSSLLLRRLVGDGWARELLLLGRVVDAEAAVRIGLVTELVDDGQLERRALEIAGAAADWSGEAMRATKTLLNGEYASWDDVVTAELDTVVQAFDTPEVKERLRAFKANRERER